MTQPPLFQEPTKADYRVRSSGVPYVDYTYTPDPGGQSGTLYPTDFQFLAKNAVAEYYNQFLRPHMEEVRDPAILPEEVFVISFEKVLQNWKAYCSTVIEDNRLFVLTYNGDKRELYIAEYVEKGNQVFVQDVVPSQRTREEHC